MFDKFLMSSHFYDFKPWIGLTFEDELPHFYKHQCYWNAEDFLLEIYQQFNDFPREKKSCYKTIYIKNLTIRYMYYGDIFSNPIYKPIFAFKHLEQNFFDSWNLIILNEVIFGPKNRPIRRYHPNSYEINAIELYYNKEDFYTYTSEKRLFNLIGNVIIHRKNTISDYLKALYNIREQVSEIESSNFEFPTDDLILKLSNDPKK